MGLWKSLAGVVYIEITSASPGDVLTAANNQGIPLFDITYVGDLCVKANIYRYDLRALIKLLSRRGEKLKIIRKSGLYFTVANLRKRPVLVAGLAFLFLLMLYLPTRIFFVRVEGTESIPAQLIIERAQACGIGFGASRREVRSERMKNALLEAIPELQWAGINTAGCVAVISVQERSTAAEEEQTKGVSSIVALRDGIINEITVLRGNALCKVGQAVKEGQVLVSGYTDCGIFIKAETAKAEIMAQTLHSLKTVTPVSHTKRGAVVKEEISYSLRVGKNIINFCKDSGISDTTCVKMYKEDYLTLPGGFQLPIALVTEHLVYYENEACDVSDVDAFVWMEDLSKTYLHSQMIAGRIVTTNLSTEVQEGICRQYGEYACIEMIGQVRSEEIITGNG